MDFDLKKDEILIVNQSILVNLLSKNNQENKTVMKKAGVFHFDRKEEKIAENLNIVNIIVVAYYEVLHVKVGNFLNSRVVVQNVLHYKIDNIYILLELDS